MQSPSRTAPNKYPRKMNKREAGVFAKFGKQMASFMYDFSKDGGAIASYASGFNLPANSVVTNVYTDEQTAFTSATSAVRFTVKAGATALTAATDPTASAGIQAPALAGSAAGIKVASASALTFDISAEAATAGKMRVAVEFYISE